MIFEVSRCSVFACDGPVVARGLCDTHYCRWKRHKNVDHGRPADWGKRSDHPLYKYWKQLRRNGTPLCEAWQKDFWAFVTDVGERPSPDHTIYRPNKSLPIGSDNAAWDTSKAGPARDGFHLKDRENKKLYMREYVKRRRAADPFHELRNGLKTTHGITLEEYERMLEAQKHVCAICGRTEHRRSTSSSDKFRLAVDHDHGSAKIRGLLCSMCNHAVGYLDDSPELLRRAIAYLLHPPAEGMGIQHNGKHKVRRIEREPSPYARAKLVCDAGKPTP